MTHLVRLQIQLGGGVFEHLQNCIFYIGKNKSQMLGSEIMCHCALKPVILIEIFRLELTYVCGLARIEKCS